MDKITPNPGYLLTSPYVEPNKGFTSYKAKVGEAQISVVVAVGLAVEDDQGKLRQSPHTFGEVIIHAYNAKDFELHATRYRMVHFTECYGVWEDAPKEKE